MKKIVIILIVAMCMTFVKPVSATSFGAYYGHESASGGSGIVIDTIDGKIVGVMQVKDYETAVKLAAFHIGLLSGLYHVKAIKVSHQGHQGYGIIVNRVNPNQPVP